MDYEPLLASLTYDAREVGYTGKGYVVESPSMIRVAGADGDEISIARAQHFADLLNAWTLELKMLLERYPTLEQASDEYDRDSVVAALLRSTEPPVPGRDAPERLMSAIDFIVDDRVDEQPAIFDQFADEPVAERV